MLHAYEDQTGKKIDLLLCCGDFQALRNKTDFKTIAMPERYQRMGTFHKYYSGVQTAPILTVFVGGNHEASSYLQELNYGGWVAPNIYYLGAAGVIRYRGLRISGISGIYKPYNYRKGRYERPPYNKETLRSIYHVRNVDVARLCCLANNKNHQAVTDIMMSHDWPRGIEQHGNTQSLLKKKKFFAEEVRTNTLGSPSNEELLNVLKPKRWFAAHLHVMFNANYFHGNSLPPTTTTSNKSEQSNDNQITDSDFIPLNITTDFMGLEPLSNKCDPGTEDLSDLMTKFLSLDKCLPQKRHLQVLNMASQNDDSYDTSLHYDLEWLAILQKTNHWTNRHNSFVSDPDYSSIHITDQDLDDIRNRLKQKYHNGCDVKDEDLTRIPNNFAITIPPHKTNGWDQPVNGGQMVGNPQTDDLLDLLGLDHIVTVPFNIQDQNNHATSMISGQVLDSKEPSIDQILSFLKDGNAHVKDANEIDIDDENIIINNKDPDEINIDDVNDSTENNIDSNEIDIDDV